MKKILYILLLFQVSCSPISLKKATKSAMTASELLGNKNYQAICYGGYRTNTRDVTPTVSEIKEDLKILSAINIKFIRTYNVHFKEITHLLQAIAQLKQENKNFEMYVMLGAWIDCKNAWTNSQPIHNEESPNNEKEINQAVQLANQYPDIVKIIAVGNEAMVKWATSYYVTPNIILKWVNYLQEQKKEGKLSNEVWITSSDNFASWGGGDKEYHTQDLNSLIKAVDYISMHTYPMHDTHYNPTFWGLKQEETNYSEKEKIDFLMNRASQYAIKQYNSVVSYMKALGVNKPVHIGETGWATISNERYGNEGSRATDEYKSAIYYRLMRNWSNENAITCFYFEAFDENWKDAKNPLGSENHFGLINLQSQAKYLLWDEVDKGTFKGLTRGGMPITKTYQGSLELLFNDVKIPQSILPNTYN